MFVCVCVCVPPSSVGLKLRIQFHHTHFVLCIVSHQWDENLLASTSHMIFILWLNLVLDIAGEKDPKAASSSRLSVFSGLGLGRLIGQLMGRRTENNSKLPLVHSQNVHLPKVDNFLLPAKFVCVFQFQK